MNGQFHGTNSYVVTSANVPVASNLPAEEPIATGSHDQMLQLFGDPPIRLPRSPAAAPGCSRTTLLMVP